jgi:hypothetical protein
LLLFLLLLLFQPLDKRDSVLLGSHFLRPFSSFMHEDYAATERDNRDAEKAHTKMRAH